MIESANKSNLETKAFINSKAISAAMEKCVFV